MTYRMYVQADARALTHRQHQDLSISLTIVPQLSVVLSGAQRRGGRPGGLRHRASDGRARGDERASARGGGENANNSGGELHDNVVFWVCMSKSNVR